MHDGVVHLWLACIEQAKKDLIDGWNEKNYSLEYRQARNFLFGKDQEDVLSEILYSCKMCILLESKRPADDKEEEPDPTGLLQTLRYAIVREIKDKNFLSQIKDQIEQDAGRDEQNDPYAWKGIFPTKGTRTS